MAGRPSTFTDVTRDIVLDALRKGLTRSAAAGRANVHCTQLRRWCEYSANFAKECEIAEQEAEAKFTEMAFPENGEPKEALEWLKRRRRLDYGDSLDIRKLDDDTILRLLSTQAGGDPSQSSDE